MLVLYLVALLACTPSEAIIIDDSPVTHGVEVSIKEWLGESSFPLKMEKPTIKSEDPQCNLIVSAVKAALFFKKLQGVLTEEEVARALDQFDSCWVKMCRNSAMIDKFGEAETFKEQINILIAKAKMPKLAKTEGQEKILKYLIDSKYHDIYAGKVFPPLLSEDSLADDKEVAIKVIEKICFRAPYAADLNQADVATLSFYVLVDRYISDSVTGFNITQFTFSNNPEKFWMMWNRIAERVFAPTSYFATSCLDPAIAFYNHERASVKKIKEFATEKLGIDCDVIEGSGLSTDRDKTMAYGDYDSSSLEQIVIEYSYVAAPGPSFDSGPPSGAPGAPGNTDSGPPSSGGSTSGGPPAPGR